MAIKKVLDASLEAVADAIRAKGETAADLTFPNGFVTAIQAIPTGGGDEWKEKYQAYLSNDAVEFPDDTTELRTYALYGFPNMTDADVAALPDSLEILGAFCMGNNPHLTEIDLSGKSLILLGENCFSNNSRITKIDLSDNDLVTLGNQLMINCPSLLTVDLSDNPRLKKIPDYFMFSSDASASFSILQTFDLTGTPIEEIGEYAFYMAQAGNYVPYSFFTSLTTLKKIGAYAFANAYNTATQTLDLSGCTSLEEIANNAFDYIGSATNKGLSSVKFPASLKTIGNYAFRKNILGTIDFSECRDLVSIGTQAFVCPGGRSTTEVDFSGCTHLETISDNAFGTYSPSALRTIGKVTFPSTKLTTIGKEVFRQAGLANQGTLTVRTGYLGQDSFRQCTGITRVDLEFDSCGTSPFYGDTGITEVHMMNTPTGPWPGNITTYPVFYNCSNVTDIYVPWSSGDIPETYFFKSNQNPTWHYNTV